MIYALAVFAPLAGALESGLPGKAIGDRAAMGASILGMVISAICGPLACFQLIGGAASPAVLDLGTWIEAAKLEQRKAAALGRGVCEGERDRLPFVARHCFGRRKIAALARADQPIQIAAHDRSVHRVIRSDQPLCGCKIFRGPLVEIGPDTQRSLH